MTPFEEQLRRAMIRREPAEDFTSRVLAEAKREAAVKAESNWWAGLRLVPAWRLMGAVVVLLLASGSVIYEQHERAARGQAAKEKLMTAVRIAGVKLRQVHRQVLEAEAAEVNQ